MYVNLRAENRLRPGGPERGGGGGGGGGLKGNAGFILLTIDGVPFHWSAAS